MINKLLSFVLAITVSFLFLVSGFSMAEEPIKFGLVAPFTGLGSILGGYIKEAMMLAVDEINDQGGINGRPIKVIIYDTEASPATAINVVKKVIQNDRVNVLFGPNMSSATLGVHKVAWDNQVIQLVGATSPSLRYTNLQNPWLFRLRADDKVKVDVQVEYAIQELKVKKPGIIYGSTDYCTSAKKVMEEKFAEYGITEIVAVQIKEGEKDATGQLLKLKKEKIDILMGLTHESEAAVVVRQAQQLGMDIPIVGFSAWGVPAFTDLASSAAVGVVAVQGFTPEDPNPKVQEFANNYKERYGRLPSDPGQAYYDGVYIMKYIIEKVGLDHNKMRDALETLKGFPGLQGEIACDQHHNLSRFSIVSEFEGDSWRIIQKYE